MGHTPQLDALTEDCDLASRRESERRDSDWGGDRRTHAEELAWAARRAAVSMAAATIHATDGGTGAHSDDVVHLCDAIADELGILGHDRAELLAAAQLHDIGKIGVPHEVLDKPGPLDDREWALIREHTVAGQQIVQSVPELHEVARLVRHSHERWDGAGYPDGLAGEQIPLASRIVFCADAFHAIRSDRPYRRGRNADAALDEVKRSAGSQFDPEVVDALVRSAGQMRNTVRGGAGGLATSLRSRRLASLLLTLAIGGSALAAGGSYLLRDEGDAGAEKTAPATATARDTGGDGGAPKGKRPAKADQATRTHPARSRPRRGADAGLSARSERPAASTPAAGGPGHRPTGPTGSTRGSAAPPASPGRSGEAPRRPAQPGRPIGGAPGRSEEAPGRPTPQPVDSPGPTGRSPGGR